MDNAAQDIRATRPAVSVEMVEDLRSSIRGIIYTRDDVEFKSFTRMFNGNVVTVASIVVLPIDAADVSRVVQFCNTHQLSPSVKAGGYGTAGWAINGDVVINLCKLDGCNIEAPGADGSFVGLRDMLPPNSKGKEKVVGRLAMSTSMTASGVQTTQSAGNTDGISDYRPSLGSSAKRRRSPEEDGPTPSEADLPRNPLVARFLSGSDRHAADTPAPSVRRRVDSSKDDPISRIPLRTPSMDRSADHPSSIDSFSDSTADLGAPSLGDQAIPSDKNAVPRNEANTDGKHSTDGIEATTTAQIIGSGGNDKAKEEVNAIIAQSQSTLQHSQLPSSRSNSQHPLAAMAEFHGRSQSTSQQTGRPPRGGSNLRTDDPFGYLSTAPSSFRSERDYVQQPIFRPPPQHALQTGFYSMTSSSLPVESSLSRGTPIDSTSETQVLQHQAFPYFMPSDAVPQYPCAYVTFGAGAKQKDIDLFSHSNALPAVDPNGNPCSIAYHVPFAAHPVGSSVMMLGGFGFLSRLHGLSIDALVEAEMVLADGSIVIVNETEHPDLWWALRGAGPAFGIATRYKAKAYPVPIVFAGNLIYNFNPATAASLIKHFRDCIKNAPRELYANVLFTAGPAEKGSVIVVQMCYIGAREKGQEFLQALSSWDGEPSLLNEVSEKTFIHQQDSVAQILRGKAGRQWFIRSALITSLPDEVIHKTVTEFADTPVGCTWLVELAGGAVSDCGTTCFPKSQREAAFTIVALHQWELDDDDPLCISTAEDWIHKTLTPVATAGPYPAFFGRHECPDRIVGSYGENWSRLCNIKRKYDPNGVFRNCFWPLDKDGAVVDMHVREPPSPKIGLLDDGPDSV